ncbi:universal stress protein [Vagococcus sp. WN89Y]|uniref:universal stress protein n=1 Tax=Vagococcus sp. WN89Y TaxID=3457258 RepID=UPI003FCE63DC
MYKHALVLINNEEDGQQILQSIAQNFYQFGTAITLAHVTEDFRELDITSDAFMKDSQSEEIILAKAMLSHLVEKCSFPVQVKEFVALRYFDDITHYIDREGIDLLIMGHKNRLFGSFCAHANKFINHPGIEVLIKHINTH